MKYVEVAGNVLGVDGGGGGDGGDGGRGGTFIGGGGGGVDGVSRGPRENRAAGRRPIICTHSTRASSALSYHNHHHHLCNNKVVLFSTDMPQKLQSIAHVTQIFNEPFCDFRIKVYASNQQYL